MCSMCWRPIKDVQQFEGKGLHYFIRGMDEFKDRSVLIVGGGDSAVDWANMLAPLAKQVTLIHRRDQFRAHEDSVNKLHASRCRVVPFHELRTLEGDGGVERAIIFDNRRMLHSREAISPRDESRTLLRLRVYDGLVI